MTAATSALGRALAALLLLLSSAPLRALAAAPWSFRYDLQQAACGVLLAEDDPRSWVPLRRVLARAMEDRTSVLEELALTGMHVTALGETLGSGAFGYVVKAETNRGALALKLWSRHSLRSL